METIISYHEVTIPSLTLSLICCFFQAERLYMESLLRGIRKDVAVILDQALTRYTVDDDDDTE